MLDPQDRNVFDAMVTKLRSEDPAFVGRIDRLDHPRRRLRMSIAVLLWAMAPVCIYYGGWTGLIIAVVAAAYGVRLATKSVTGTGAIDGASRRSRPGALS